MGHRLYKESEASTLSERLVANEMDRRLYKERRINNLGKTSS